MLAKVEKNIKSDTRGYDLIDDLIKDAKAQGLDEAVKTLEEFKEMLLNKKPN